MKTMIAMAIVIVALAFSRFPQSTASKSLQTDESDLKATLVNLEKQSWVAWQKRDNKFFQDFLADDHVEVGIGGPANKADRRFCWQPDLRCQKLFSGQVPTHSIQ